MKTSSIMAGITTSGVMTIMVVMMIIVSASSGSSRCTDMTLIKEEGGT